MSKFVDRNFRSIADQKGFYDTLPEQLAPGPGWDDTLKVSNCCDVQIDNKEIWNEGEDCLDLCRVHVSTFRNLILHPRGENAITVKGASSDIWLGFLLRGHGKACDVELGQFDNYWFPGRPPTCRIYLDVDPRGDAPVIRTWDAGRLSVLGPHRIVVVPRWVWLPYFYFRYTQLRLTNLWRRCTKQPQIKTS